MYNWKQQILRKYMKHIDYTYFKREYYLKNLLNITLILPKGLNGRLQIANTYLKIFNIKKIKVMLWTQEKLSYFFILLKSPLLIRSIFLAWLSLLINNVKPEAFQTFKYCCKII